ncbi:hypothetical protein ACFYNO_16305 [Kitasatospora sp. NPDC006697]|uniref:VMAP-C domain-containing protein n=1 Tax=Kitasatospora sp. NPDC006697 TaxID=3364020 RepID=UPI00368C0189
MSGPPVDPARTHALVVAAEEYGDALWNTDGPHTDALAVVDWLIRCRVPREQITVFTAPRRTRSQPGLPAGVAGLASPEELADFLGDQLRDAAGDLLWVFFSGHGMLDDQGRHQLLLPGSRRGVLRTIGAAELQQALLSDQVGLSVGLVVLVLNACADQQPANSVRTKPLPVRIDPVEVVPDRGFFAIQAAGPGRAAWTVPDRDRQPGEPAGRLPRELLAVLGDRLVMRPSLLQEALDDRFGELFKTRGWHAYDAQLPGYQRFNWPHERDTVAGPLDRWASTWRYAPTRAEERLQESLAPWLPADGLRPVLAELRTGGLELAGWAGDGIPQLVFAARHDAHGLPTVVEALLDRLGPGRPAADDCRELWDRVAQIGDEYLTRQEHRELLELLAPVPVAGLLGLLGLRHEWREHWERQPAGEASAERIVRALEAPGPVGPVPVLLEYLAAVAAAVGEGARGLTGWCGRLCARLAVEPGRLREQARRLLEAAGRCAGSLVVEVVEADGGFRWHAWAGDALADYRELRAAEEHRRSTDWAGVEQEVGALLAARLEPDRPVEFLLPADRVDLPVELLPVPAGGPPLGAGADARVRLRRPRPSQGEWRRRSRQLYAAEAPEGRWISHHPADGPSALAAELDRLPLAAGVELLGALAEQRAALDLCVTRGVPVVTVWRGGGADRPSTRQLLGGAALAELPARVRPERITPVQGADSVIVVSDDAERMPPEPRWLHSPRRRMRR